MVSISAISLDGLTLWGKFEVYCGASYAREVQKVWQKAHESAQVQVFEKDLLKLQDYPAALENLRTKNLFPLVTVVCFVIEKIVFFILGIESKKNFLIKMRIVEVADYTVEEESAGIEEAAEDHYVLCYQQSRQNPRELELFFKDDMQAPRLSLSFEAENILTCKFIKISSPVGKKEKDLILAAGQFFYHLGFFSTFRIIPSDPSDPASKDILALVSNPGTDLAEKDPAQPIDCQKSAMHPYHDYTVRQSLPDCFIKSY